MATDVANIAFLPGVSARTASLDTGLLSLALAGAHHRIAVDPNALAHELGLAGTRAGSEDLVRAANLVGLKARLIKRMPLERLKTAPRPIVLKMRDSRFFVLNRLADGTDTLRDPLAPIPRPAIFDELAEEWDGEAILVTRQAALSDVVRKFEFRWFLEAVWRYRGPLSHVLIASFFVQLFALVSPLFFQVVVDKVLVHQSTSTLYVVVTALVLIGLFDVGLQYLRSYALYHTSSRVDVELGSQVFSRLMKLPLAYFETRPAGWTVSRLREIETIRQFLTGQALTSSLDLLFTLLFIIFLFTYSVTLTIVVIISIPLYILIAMVIRPVLRDRINEKFNRNATNQQFLVETVVGAPTLKSAAVEPLIQEQWEDKLAGYVKTSFNAVMLGTIGQNAIQYVSKLVTAMIILFGAQEVISGDMTVGELIAFNMIAGQLVQPILRLSQLWQDFQQIQISITRLGDILNCPTELHAGSVARLPQSEIRGAIAFENVVFRYRPGTPEVLKGITLDIPVGQVVGIVGPSGSGKSTMTKLLQRLYIPERGKITVDGIDIAEVHPAWLRRQIGVVLQENLLFNRTIHDNIALSVPGMSRDRVIAVAKLAGADEFIRSLPQGYDTHIEERGANLSGGQRQRVAIARALAVNPRVLILDEATSALDYESERIVQANMKEIVRGRTVVIVAHRLAAVRGCDRIIALEDGMITEDGTHDQLLHRLNGLYSRLWALQTAAAGE
jgi:subfamily B ATP-binding cassette protein HlyB/CyaB